MLWAGIFYWIYGGYCFFECLEIKNVLVYLCLICYCDDDVVFEWVVNILFRGLGDKFLECICSMVCEFK